ncbi:MAG: hypothetical protein B9S32_10940 [Verrucomicrobia bacterium Tous-C9LFEB]|nr:MAG: hypothetical protein B9S32_10940 [Verrucomicrobia bacterium Tous-C9LFEB]
MATFSVRHLFLRSPLFFALLFSLASLSISQAAEAPSSPLRLQGDTWRCTATIVPTSPQDSAWLELRGAKGERLYRVGLTGAEPQLHQWKEQKWQVAWKGKSSEIKNGFEIGLFRYGNYLFIECGEAGDARLVTDLNGMPSPQEIDCSERPADPAQSGKLIKDVQVVNGGKTPVKHQRVMDFPKSAIACYLPWFPADYTSLGYQRQYDFPVIPLSTDPANDVFTAQLQEMAQHGVGVVEADMVFFTPDRVRAAITLFKTMLDSVEKNGPKGMKVLPFLELKDIPLTVAGALYMEDRLGTNPHWLRAGKRPIFLTYHHAEHMAMTPDKWRQLLESMAAGGADTYWVYNFEGLQPAIYGTVNKTLATNIMEVTDGAYHFGGSSLMESAHFTGNMRRDFSAKQPTVAIGAALHPGYYSARTYNRNLISPRHTAELREQWKLVSAAKPDFLHLTTWNDWNEATNFCPGFGDLGARLEIVQRFLADYLQTPLPEGNPDEPEAVLSYRKALYPGEPLTIELLPLPTKSGPAQSRWKIEIGTQAGRKLLSAECPALDQTRMEPWITTAKLPADLEPSQTLKVTLTCETGEKFKKSYSHLPDIALLDPITYGDQLYYSIPVHRLASSGKSVSLLVNGATAPEARGNGLYAVTYQVTGGSAKTVVAGMKRGHLMRFLAPLNVSGAEVGELNRQVELKPETSSPVKRTSSEWQPRWTSAERGPDYFAAVAQFEDGTWAYSPTVFVTSPIDERRIIADWVFSGPKPALMGNVKGLDQPANILMDRSIYRNDLPLPTEGTSRFVTLPGNGRAYQFDGKTVLKAAEDAAGNGPLTVEVLFRLSENRRNQVLCMQRGAQINLMVEADGSLTAQRLPENRKHPNPFVKVRSRDKLEADRFYHVTCAFDGEEIRLYLNGKLQGNAKCPGTRSTEGFFIGGTVGSAAVVKEIDGVAADGGFTGQMVRFTLFGQALGEEEIQRLYTTAQLLPFWSTTATEIK